VTRRRSRLGEKPGVLLAFFLRGEISTIESAEGAFSAISTVEDFWIKEGKYAGPAFGYKATV
jgi:hypothetical protein